jgi:hypothetical protein
MGIFDALYRKPIAILKNLIRLRAAGLRSPVARSVKRGCVNAAFLRLTHGTRPRHGIALVALEISPALHPGQDLKHLS